MVSTRSRVAAAATPMAPRRHTDLLPAPMSTPPANHEAYERSREERIRANLEKMQKLGIIDLGLKLRAEKQVPSVKRELKSPQSGRKTVQQPSRRSSRLQGVPSVCYSEGRRGAQLELEDGVVDGEEKKGGRPWNFDEHCQIRRGARIYDKINGKTCHQCRQKTLCSHACCSKCEGVQGQFCGGCLRARYGEQIQEALANPNWICPVCRGICNCSLCRMKHGLAPTGQIFYKVATLGFKSVAHYLTGSKITGPVELARDENDSVSTKRSLTFAEN